MATWYFDVENGSNYAGGDSLVAAPLVLSDVASYHDSNANLIYSPTGGFTSGMTGRYAWMGDSDGGTERWWGTLTYVDANHATLSGSGYSVAGTRFLRVGGPWLTLGGGGLAARIAPGDNFRFKKSPDPIRVTDEASNVLKAIWTDNSEIVTLRNDAGDGDETATAVIDHCETIGTGDNQWDKSDANVTLGRSSTYAKQGTYSVSMSIVAAFATDTLIAWCDLPDTAASEYGSYTGVSFWIQAAAAIVANTLRFRMYSAVNAGGSVLEDYLIPFKLESGRWYPVSYNKGSALSSTRVRSIGLYAEEDPGTVIIYIDNIFAHNGLSLQSLITKNYISGGTNQVLEGTVPTYWPVKSIVGSTITLGESQMQGTSVTKFCTFETSPETVAIYRQETSKCTVLATSSTTAIHTTTEHGSYANPNLVSGGWSNDTTRDGYTWLDGLNGWGSGILLVNYAYGWSYFGLTRFYRGFGATTYTSKRFFEMLLCGNNDYNFALTTGIIEEVYNICSNANGNGQSSAMGCEISLCQIKDSVVLGDYNPLRTNGDSFLRNCRVKGHQVYAFAPRGRAFFENCKVDVSALTSYLILNNSYIPLRTGFVSFLNYNQVVGDNRTYMTYGGDGISTDASWYDLLSDATIYHGASGKSLRMVPRQNNTTYRAESAPNGEGVEVAVAASGDFTISVWVKRATAVAYPIRLVCKRQNCMGVTADVVIDSTTDTTTDWQQLTGSISAAGITPSQDGVLEFIVDCYGTASDYINIDDWSVS